MGTRVQVLREVQKKLNDGETLCLQQVFYDHGGNIKGDIAFRFIRRDVKGNMKAQRGQAAIPALHVAQELILELNTKAMKIS